MSKYTIFVAFIVAFGCSQKQNDITAEAHNIEIEQWHSKRVESLKGPQGWLNIAGLFWLNDGMNTFGSGETNDLVFPTGKIAVNAGYFTLKNGVVTVEAPSSSEIKINNEIVKSAVVFYPDSSGSKQPRMEHSSLLWFIIERGGKFGVRLRDFESEGINGFHGIERYPIDLKWRVEATLEKAPEGKTIDIVNVLGQTSAEPSQGTLVFQVDGTEYRLDAISEGGPDLFVIFGDPTNEKETYPSGRYVYVTPPGEDGKTTLDFNKCYNPPCAFTPYATCPLPPRQNLLPIPVLAGEKNYGGAGAHAQNL